MPCFCSLFIKFIVLKIDILSETDALGYGGKHILAQEVGRTVAKTVEVPPHQRDELIVVNRIKRLCFVFIERFNQKMQRIQIRIVCEIRRVSKSGNDSGKRASCKFNSPRILERLRACLYQ
jgi:hypothetical protein